MGIVKNAGVFVKGKVKTAVDKAADGVANASELSNSQLEKIQARREQYFSEVTGKDNSEIIKRNLASIGIEIHQAYLKQLKGIYAPIDVLTESFSDKYRIRYFEITRWVTDTEEKSIDRLANVYQTLAGEDCSVSLIIQRSKEGTRIFVAVVNNNNMQTDPSVIKGYYERLKSTLEGNFPGVNIVENAGNGDLFGIGTVECLKSIDKMSISIVSNVASEKSEDFISQSIEKVLDGVVPKNSKDEYTIVLLGKSLVNQIEEKNRLYELYTALSPYASWQTGISAAESHGESASFTLGGNASFGISSASQVGANIGIGVPGEGGASIGASKTITTSANFGVNFSRASNVSATISKNESLNQTYTNYGVKHALELLEKQLQRIESSEALGRWEFSAYVLSENPVIANNVAHTYLALTQGEESFVNSSTMESWNNERESDSTCIICKYLQRLQHPIFGLKSEIDDSWLSYPIAVTPAVSISGMEFAQAMNMPRKSVSGFPVLETVSFGREPHSLINTELSVDLGCGYHMRKIIDGQRISLSKEELTKHTFITGSTGSGKSNTVYRLLEKLAEERVHFLVVEPAKGEYKDVLGKKNGVTTYGTNPNVKNTRLLRINPFRFPKSTHILEHLDRLVEIFNVCWPMYAAMPAILKDSVERAYVACGWDIESSVNKFDSELFPSFSDVVEQIKQVLDESDYSADNKGDYTGSLVTRLKSLTNGINGLVFTTDDIPDEILFDQNVIIDLSRVGSVETKSLIMGLIVLKLQEYRMHQRSLGANANDDLKHITVIEEAHNILKRTSMDQSAEGSNMIGKSVEMLANSIAEMRTYGEGFVIADQSPGLLDMSVIRNTNTKIILRLPDFSDRELVGKASGLTDNQIIELAKLEKGVAVISQSDWLEAVLCKIDKYEGIGQPFCYDNVSVSKTMSVNSDLVSKSLLDCIMKKEIYRKGDRVDIQKLRTFILRSKLDSKVKCDFIKYVDAGKDEAIIELRNLAFDFFKAKEAIENAQSCDDLNEWIHMVAENLHPSLNNYTKRQIDLLMALIIYEQSIRDASYNSLLCRYTELLEKNGGVF